MTLAGPTGPQASQIYTYIVQFTVAAHPQLPRCQRRSRDWVSYFFLLFSFTSFSPFELILGRIIHVASRVRNAALIFISSNHHPPCLSRQSSKLGQQP